MEPTPNPSHDAQHRDAKLLGSCGCGRITYKTFVIPTEVSYCHCRECRKYSGNPYGVFGLLHNDAIEWRDMKSPSTSPNSGIDLIHSDLAARGFCKDCRTPLLMKYHCRPDGTNLTMGTVDEMINADPAGVKVNLERLFVYDTGPPAPWSVPEGDAIKTHERFDPGYVARLREWEDKGKPKRGDL